MRRLLAIAFCSACFLVTGSANAQTPSTGRDYSDLWWNAAESGWGANVVHQGNILFITMFLYGTDGRPTWYLSSAVQYVSTDSSGNETFRGDLAQVTGSPFNQPFNPGATQATVVGQITFIGLANGGATLNYNVNGVPNGNVTKSVTRLTWRANTVTSTEYSGATVYTRSGCTTPSLNGPQFDSAVYTLTVTNDTFTLREVNGPTAICNWNGTYTQAGRYGAASGVATCEDNIPANFTWTDVQISPQGFSAKFSATETSGPRCSAVGRISGTRR